MANTITKVIGWITLIIIVIITLVVVFSFVGNTSPTITDAANSVVYPHNCSSGKDAAGKTLTFNLTSLQCENSTGGQFAARIDAMPLVSLFSPSGVLLIILMAAIFIVALVLVIYMVKRK